jgi:hypothetical protein
VTTAEEIKSMVTPPHSTIAVTALLKVPPIAATGVKPLPLATTIIANNLTVGVPPCPCRDAVSTSRCGLDRLHLAALPFALPNVMIS